MREKKSKLFAWIMSTNISLVRLVHLPPWLQGRPENSLYFGQPDMPQLKIRDSSIIKEGRNGYWQSVGSLYHKELIQILEDVNIWTNQDIEMQLFSYI